MKLLKDIDAYAHIISSPNPTYSRRYEPQLHTDVIKQIRNKLLKNSYKIISEYYLSTDDKDCKDILFKINFECPGRVIPFGSSISIGNDGNKTEISNLVYTVVCYNTYNKSKNSYIALGYSDKTLRNSFISYDTFECTGVNYSLDKYTYGSLGDSSNNFYYGKNFSSKILFEKNLDDLLTTFNIEKNTIQLSTNPINTDVTIKLADCLKKDGLTIDEIVFEKTISDLFLDKNTYIKELSTIIRNKIIKLKDIKTSSFNFYTVEELDNIFQDIDDFHPAEWLFQKNLIIQTFYKNLVKNIINKAIEEKKTSKSAFSLANDIFSPDVYNGTTYYTHQEFNGIWENNPAKVLTTVNNPAGILTNTLSNTGTYTVFNSGSSVIAGDPILSDPIEKSKL